MARASRPLSKAAQQRRRKIQSAQTTYQRQEQRYRQIAANLPMPEAEMYLNAAEMIANRREALRGIDVRRPSTITQDQKFYIKDAVNFSVGANSTDWARGESLGRLRLSGTTLGHNFFAATKTLWEGVSYNMRLDAIRRAIGKIPSIISEFGKRPNANQLIEIVSRFFENSFFDDSESLQLGSPPDAAFVRGQRQLIANYG